MNIEKKILNSLFYFNIKQKKVILSIEYQKKLNFATSGSLLQEKGQNDIKDISTREILKNSDKNKNINFIPYLAKKSPMIRKYSKVVKNNRNNRNENFISFHRKSVSFAKNNHLEKLYNGQNDASKDILLEIQKNKNRNGIKRTVVNKNNVTFSDKKFNNNLNELNLNKLYIRSKSKESEDLKKFQKDNFCNIDFNIFEYYCFWKYTKKKTQIELFRFAYKFFKSQMDIINFFNIMILVQIMMKKQSDEKNNFLSEIVELSM